MKKKIKKERKSLVIFQRKVITNFFLNRAFIFFAGSIFVPVFIYLWTIFSRRMWVRQFSSLDPAEQRTMRSGNANETNNNGRSNENSGKIKKEINQI